MKSNLLRSPDYYRWAVKHMLERYPVLYRGARQAKRLGRLLTGHDRIYHYDIKPHKETLGTFYGGWTIIPELIKSDSVIYSFGVGNDISFDLAVIERFGATVHGFDPSPRVIRFIADQVGLPSRYIFHPYGLGTEEGEMEFFSPIKGRNYYSICEGSRFTGDQREFLPVKTVPAIMGSLGTRYIDLLKMDVDGAEYAQIDTLIQNAASIGQLMIEFHHRVGLSTLQETVDCVNRLRAAGFKLFHVADTSAEFSFVRDPRL
jgi:FkbM family methyltransferase